MRKLGCLFSFAVRGPQPGLSASQRAAGPLLFLSGCAFRPWGFASHPTSRLPPRSAAGQRPTGTLRPFEKVDETFSPLRAADKTKGTAFAVPSAYGVIIKLSRVETLLIQCVHHDGRSFSSCNLTSGTEGSILFIALHQTSGLSINSHPGGERRKIPP